MDEDDEGIYGLDYTAIVKHRGKQFTVSDISLSAVGGVDIPAALLAAAFALPVGLVVTVIFAVLGFNAFVVFTIAFGVVLVGLYIYFSRERIDSQAPRERLQLAVSTWRNQPDVISIGRRPAQPKSPLLLLIGGAKPHEDLHPTVLHWSVILKRPSDPEHFTAGGALQGRVKYEPRPAAPHVDVMADDQGQFADFYEYLSKKGTR